MSIVTRKCSRASSILSAPRQPSEDDWTFDLNRKLVLVISGARR